MRGPDLDTVVVVGRAVSEARAFTRFYLVSWIGERFVADIRKRVFDHLIQLHPGFYESNRASEIQSRLTADTTLLQSVIGSSLSMALRNGILLVDENGTLELPRASKLALARQLVAEIARRLPG